MEDFPVKSPCPTGPVSCIVRSWMNIACCFIVGYANPGYVYPEVKKQIRKIYLTHDVDSPTLYRSWKGLIRSIRDRRGLYKSFQGKFGTLEKDPFYTFPWFFRQNSILQDLIGKEQCHPILFIRNGGKAKHDKPHYDLRNKDIRKLIKSALEHNVTIGLHSSYQAGTTPSLIRKEKTGLEDHIGKKCSVQPSSFLGYPGTGRYGPNRGCWVTDDSPWGMPMSPDSG